MDHGFLLAQALLEHLPWLSESNAGIHTIGIADGNGWEQSKEGGFYYPSKRSKLTIRIQREHLDSVKTIIGKTLDLGEYKIKVVKFINKFVCANGIIIHKKAKIKQKNAYFVCHYN